MSFNFNTYTEKEGKTFKQILTLQEKTLNQNG